MSAPRPGQMLPESCGYRTPPSFPAKTLDSEEVSIRPSTTRRCLRRSGGIPTSSGGRKCWLPKWTGGLPAARPSRTGGANSSLSISTSRCSFRAEGSVRSSCDQSRSEPEQKESRQSLLARAGTQRAWLGSHFPGGNTSGTSSPTKRKTNGPGQSDRGSARYDCGKNSWPNEILADEHRARCGRRAAIADVHV